LSPAAQQLRAPGRLAKILRALAELQPDELPRLADELDGGAVAPGPRRSLRQRIPRDELTTADFDAAAHQERRNGIEHFS
jgi:hypothetical protein